MNLEQWPTEAEAATAIGCSVRTLQRYAASGKIEIRTRPREGKKPENVCNPRDVDRLLPAAHVMPESSGPTNGVPAVNNFGNGKQTDAFFAFIAAITTAISTRQHVAMPTPPRQWLSIEEASAYSGLSEGFIRRQIALFQITAVRGGDRGALRVYRPSLEVFAG